ncbi:MAG: hypothetical protein ACKVS9_16570 [Phycisphaerae bacterium]
MDISIGDMRAGRVDVVPGLFYVVTDFTHFCYFPVFARESHVVFTQAGSRPPSVAIPLSPKSIAFAYVRAICVVIGWFAALLAIGLHRDSVRKPDEFSATHLWFPVAVSSGGALTLLALSYLPLLNRAGAARARAIARQIWLPERVVDQIGAIAAGERVYLSAPLAELFTDAVQSPAARKWNETS